MMKRIGRRLVSLLLTVVTVLTMLPAMTLPALAATSGTVTGLTDTDIGLSFTGDAGDVEDPWTATATATGAQIIGHVEAETDWSGEVYSEYSTLTITNNKSTKATLSFDYTVVLSGGTIQVDGTAVTADSPSSFSKELEPGGNTTVYIFSGEGDGQYAKITMSNVKLVADATATVTFQPAVNGSYTVDGIPITDVWTDERSSEKAYQVAATPADGYLFLGWYNVTEGKFISIAPNTALNIEKNCVVTARFASETAALFETNGQRFDDLNEAVAAAQKQPPATIKLIADGTITGSYTIPYDVTLLIPFDKEGTLYGGTPTATRSAQEPEAFRTLTMAAGSSITLASGAALSVGGQYYAGAGGESGKMVGPYGHIIMESGSAITVQDGASLYAWGFISGSGSGSGSVTVESGGSVYEWYQILDFRGGYATSDIATVHLWRHIFPLSQYTVQNVEVPLTLFMGASETVYAAVYANDKIYLTPVQFIHNNGMFKLNSGSLTKTYDGSTDRLIYTINGDAEVNSLSLSLAKVKLDSSNYVLPFTNNMTVVLKSGSKLTMNQTAALLPSVSVTIEKNAELVVPKNQSMYIYDVDEWGNYCFSGSKYVASVSVPYAPGRTPGTRASLTDANVDINGTLTAIGSVYTTKSGANICSSEGGGRFVQKNTPGTEKKIYQVTRQPAKLVLAKFADISITPAQLQNAAVAPTQTKDAKAGDTFTYCNCPTCGGTWVKNLMVAEFNGTQYGTLKEAVNEFPQDSNGSTYIKMLHNTTENITADRNLYLDLNGYTVTGYFKMGSNTLYGMDSSSKEYTAPSGKIVGGVSNYAKTYETPKVMEGDVETYDRYVAILGAENTLSFHHFNISVTGYRFELTSGDTPKCALFFIGKFRGDDAAKDRLKKLSFTLTGDNGADPKEGSCTLPQALGNEVFPDDIDGAYLFEFYLMRSFGKDASAASFTESIHATAKATFQNQSDLGEQVSNERTLSFQEAWENADNLNSTQREIINKILRDHGINP